MNFRLMLIEEAEKWLNEIWDGITSKEIMLVERTLIWEEF